MTEPSRSTSKTIYILGAGFSHNAGIPLQAQILEGIHDMNLLDMPSSLSEKFLDAQSEIFTFIEKIFEQVPTPSLEDVFTLLDQSINRRSYCVGYSWQELEEVRSALYTAIVVLLHTRGRKISKQEEFYDSVAACLIKERLAAGQEGDPFSVISLNWDCVLENAIYWCLGQCNTTKADIDYCCYTNPFQGTSRHTPSINQKALGLYNIKVLKPHGSVNWVICPNCNRLYAGLGAPVQLMEEYIVGDFCIGCEKALAPSEEDEVYAPFLEPFIITPTFVKEFDNAHIQMVWHNAYIELREATKVVFIGYSLPEADYHLRTLLKRAIRPDAKIVVVLMENDKPPEHCGDHIRDKYAVSRYKAFFGSEPKVEFKLEGVKEYFKEVLEDIPLLERIEFLRQEFRKFNTTNSP